MDGRYDAAAEAVTKQLPHSIELEQAVLGSILIDNRALDRVTDILEAAHFHDPLHARIFDVLRASVESGRLANPMTVAQDFTDAPEIKPGVSVIRYLGTLAVNAVSTASVRDYAEGIKDYSIRRDLILIGETMAREAYANATDAPSKAVIEQAEAGLYELAESGTYGKGSQHIGAIVTDVIVEANDAYLNHGRPTGLMTGFKDVDAKLHGLKPGNLIILAGRPSMGKTAIALNMAWNIAKSGTPVQFDSMEMSNGELGLRLLAEQSGINSNDIQTGSLKGDQFRDLQEASRRIAESKLYVDDAGGLTIGKLAARARRVKRQRGIGCMFVDYLQLMAGGSNNRVSDVTQITTGLKALAKDLEIPIIALSQLSRKCEDRTDKRPQLADLRDSGSIEQDADVVLFVYRDEYYVEREKPAGDKTEWRYKLAEVAGKAEVIVAKQRHGSCGIIEMAFDSNLTRFSDLVKDPHPSMERHQ